MQGRKIGKVARQKKSYSRANVSITMGRNTIKTLEVAFSRVGNSSANLFLGHFALGKPLFNSFAYLICILVTRYLLEVFAFFNNKLFFSVYSQKIDLSLFFNYGWCFVLIFYMA